MIVKILGVVNQVILVKAVLLVVITRVSLALLMMGVLLKRLRKVIILNKFS